MKKQTGLSQGIKIITASILSFGMVFPIILMIIFLISGNLTKRISKLSSAMENFKIGNKGADLQISLTTAKNPDYFDEIDKLGVTFLNMQSSINKNMHSILELTLSEEKLKYRLLNVHYVLLQLWIYGKMAIILKSSAKFKEFASI